jgi:uncharacterized protein (DUF1330 family)
MPKGYVISRVDVLNPEAYARYDAARPYFYFEQYLVGAGAAQRGGGY